MLTMEIFLKMEGRGGGSPLLSAVLWSSSLSSKNHRTTITCLSFIFPVGYILFKNKYFRFKEKRGCHKTSSLFLNEV